MNSIQGKRPIAEKVQQLGCTTDTLGDIGGRILLADELMRLPQVSGCPPNRVSPD